MSSADVKTYLQQWISTATKDKVAIDFAWFARRMTLVCTSCNQQLTAPLPEDQTDIDYSVQEFVKIHSHTGSHHSGCSCMACVPGCTRLKKDGTTACIEHTMPDGAIWMRCVRCGKQVNSGKVKPVTIDFKAVTKAATESIIEGNLFKEIPPLDANPDVQDFGLTNLPKAAAQKETLPPFPPSYYSKDEAKIKAQLAQFKKEYDPKTQANIDNIKALQQEQASEQQKAALADMQAKNKVNIEILQAQIEYAKKKAQAFSDAVEEEDAVQKQAAANVAKLKQYQALQAMLNSPIGAAILKSSPGLQAILKKPEPEPPAPAPKKIVVRKDVTGRKVR